MTKDFPKDYEVASRFHLFHWDWPKDNPTWVTYNYGGHTSWSIRNVTPIQAASFCCCRVNSPTFPCNKKLWAKS